MDTETHSSLFDSSLAGLCGLILVKITQGAVRFMTLGSDISGFMNSLKCIAGFESVVDAIPNAAAKVCTFNVPYIRAKA